MLTDLNDRPVLQGRTEEELLAFITPQLEAREPFYAQADYTIDAPLHNTSTHTPHTDISDTDDLRIAEQLFNIITQQS